MPAERFWEFEDATVNLGSLTAAAEDLGLVVTVEFATVFGNDWWQVPVRANFGSLIGVRSLVVRDSFGENILVKPTRQATARPPWPVSCAASPARRRVPCWPPSRRWAPIARADRS